MIYRCQNKQTQNITPRSPLLRLWAGGAGGRSPQKKTHGHINVIQKEEEEEKSNNH